jgi:hypothetical protein
MSSDAQAAFGEPSEPRRASRLAYVAAAAVGAAAVVGAVAWFVSGLAGVGDAVDELSRVPVPGSAVVTLAAGKNAVYYEGRGSPAVQLDLQRVDGPPVTIGPHRDDTTYDAGGHHGRSIAGFTLEESGDYRLTVRGEAPAGGHVAVGKGVGGKIVSAVVGGLGIFFGGLLLCGLLIILTARARRASARGAA